jgi:hypothetical protein
LRLGGFARQLFFFSSRKDAEPCPPRWAQRNCGTLGLTFHRGGLALQPAPQNYGAPTPSAVADFLFFILAKTQSRKEIVVHSYLPRGTGFYFYFTKSPLITVENRDFFLKK